MKNRISRASSRIWRSSGLSNRRTQPEQKKVLQRCARARAFKSSLQSKFFSQRGCGTITALGRNCARNTARLLQKNSTLKHNGDSNDSPDVYKCAPSLRRCRLATISTLRLRHEQAVVVRVQ